MEKLRPGRNGGMIKNGGQNKGAGRPRKTTGVIIAELKAVGVTNVTRPNIIDTFEVMLDLTEEELKTVALNKDASMLLRITAKAMLSGKGFDVIQSMLDRAHGKPKSTNDDNDSEVTVVFKTQPAPVRKEEADDKEALKAKLDEMRETVKSL